MRSNRESHLFLVLFLSNFKSISSEPRREHITLRIFKPPFPKSLLDRVGSVLLWLRVLGRWKFLCRDYTIVTRLISIWRLRPRTRRDDIMSMREVPVLQFQTLRSKEDRRKTVTWISPQNIQKTSGPTIVDVMDKVSQWYVLYEIFRYFSKKKTSRLLLCKLCNTTFYRPRVLLPFVEPYDRRSYFGVKNHHGDSTLSLTTKVLNFGDQEKLI